MSFHMYADDTQIYGFSPPNDFPSLIDCVAKCVYDVNVWMIANKLKLNSDKTEIMPCGTAAKLCVLAEEHIHVGNEEVPFSSRVKNIGVYLERKLRMDSHVNNIIKITYLELRKLGQIRSYLDLNSTKILASACILSRLDYCNSLLSNVSEENLNKLQMVQNNAARLVYRMSKKEHVTPLLHELHWLPVKARIEYKIATMCFKSLNGHGPMYLNQLLTPYEPQRQLRSSNLNKLVIPKTNLKTYGDRAFTSTGPSVWNCLPEHLKHTTDFESFKRNLKTYLFREYLHMS